VSDLRDSDTASCQHIERGQFVIRIILGIMLLYDGLKNILIPSALYSALISYEFIPHYLAKSLYISIITIKLLLALMLLIGKGMRWTGLVISSFAAFSTSLFARSIMITTKTTGFFVGCDCYPQSILFGQNNPYYSLLFNIAFLSLASWLMFFSKFISSDMGHNISKHLSRLSFAIIAISVLLNIIIAIPLSKAEKRFTKIAQENRERLLVEAEESLPRRLVTMVFMDIHNGEMIDIREISRKSYTVLVLIKSFDCPDCIRELKFVDRLNKKYSDFISFYGIVGNISDIAIHNMIAQQSFAFQFFRDVNSIIVTNVGDSITTLKILLMSEGTILNVDPSSYGLKPIQKKYERLIKSLEKGGDIIG